MEFGRGPIQRRRTLIIPREHGAWGILLVPLVSGACVGLLEGGSAARLAPFTIAALALFWLRTPVESWTGAAPVRARTPGEFALVRNATFALSAVSIGALIWVFWDGRNRGLLWIGAGAGAAFLLQAILKRIRRSARTLAQMIGSTGLTATAPAAYYVVTGRWGEAWPLWVANSLFAVNQIHFVQILIHAAHVNDRAEKLRLGGAFLAGQVATVVLVVAACVLHFFPWYAALAFVPVWLRGFAWFTGKAAPLAIQTVGKRELAYACAFGVLLILGMGLRG